MKLWLHHTLWRVALKLRAWWLSDWRCDGYRPALSWVPTDDEGDGYYRGGIQAQYCVLFRDHKGDCLARIDDHGRKVRGGASFRPEPRENDLIDEPV